jgi:hypothetical protein
MLRSLFVDIFYKNCLLPSLSKGKSAVEVAGPQELIKTLEALKAAVEAGELDAVIDAASQSLREGFSK